MILYRLLLALVLPPGFRREWGPAMTVEAQAQLAEARRKGVVPLLVRGCALAVDALRTGAREWSDDFTMTTEGMGMRGWMQDLRVGMRRLARAPGFTAVAATTLALAIGVNALIFALVDSVLLRSLPYGNADRLVALWTTENWSREMVALAGDELRSVETVAGHGGANLWLSEAGAPTMLFVSQVTPNLHEVLGVRPVQGRGFTAEDGLPGAEAVTLLSHRIWVERFGGDPGVIGRSIALGGEGEPRRTVVGVMPPDYLPLGGPSVQAWIPVVTDPAAQAYAGSYFMAAVGLVDTGSDLAAVRVEVREWAGRMQERNPGWFATERVARADALMLGDSLVADRRTPLLIALAGVALVLLIACANLANLVLARTGSRERELSVRTALGSGRGRTIRLVLAENVLLGLLGGALGLALALGLRGAVLRWVPTLFPPEGAEVSPRVVAFTLALSMAAATLAALVPALRASRGSPAPGLSGARGTLSDRGGARLQGSLVAAQLALATVLVITAGLLGRSLAELAAVDPGFRAESGLAFTVTAPADAYPDDASVVRFFQEMRRALAQVPGVEHAGFVSRLPMGSGMSRITAYPDGVEVPEGGKVPEVDHRLVTPGYFAAIGATMREGRPPTEADDIEAEVVVGVVNRAAAERFWPDGSAVGRYFMGPRQDESGGQTLGPWLRVVGVVEDIREAGPDRPVEPALYILHRDWPWRTMSAVIRSRAGVDRDRLEAAVWSVNPSVPVMGMRTLADVAAQGRQRVRMMAILATALGGVALLIGSLGVYGVVSYAVGRRRAEFGVRVALGADRATLERSELLRAGRLVVFGVLLGVPGAWAVGRGLGSVLFGVTPLAPGVLIPVGSALTLVGLLAAWVPVRRATRVDPVEALRAE